MLRGEMPMLSGGRIDWRTIERARRAVIIERRLRERARAQALREREERRARFAPKLAAWMENGQYFERGA